jgi:WhiB family transcriptional regulator, redox-sensing transcriptional regulator
VAVEPFARCALQQLVLPARVDTGAVPDPRSASPGYGAQDWRWQWQLQAECRGWSQDLFFRPAGETHPERLERERAAKRVYATCSVVDACLAFATTTRQPYGIWGGTTEGERGFLGEHRRDTT